MSSVQSGVVVIGRNEGERLRRCLASLAALAARTVYVDSGSSDGSVALARAAGAEIVELDLSSPFCAARARNAGYRRLLEMHPELRCVQFLDGDCELSAGWMPFAADALESHPDVAIVAGWLHEMHPERSIYNRLGELEWNFSGVGEVDAVGGIFMIRRGAFDAAGGFDPAVPAGEEPELCQRLRARGWRLFRVDREMARHDLAMTRLAQWWRRAARSGYASMTLGAQFGIDSYRRNNWRARLWSAWLGVLGIAVGGVALGSAQAALLAAALVALWCLQTLRIALRAARRGQPAGIALAYAFFIMLSFWPQMGGQLLYLADALRKRRLRLFEYKSASLRAGDP